MILDGGPTTVGIESTVLSLVGPEAVLLRPGMVSRAQIEELIGPVQVLQSRGEEAAHPSPGMHPRHYSPKTSLVLVSGGHLPSSGRGAYCGSNARRMRRDVSRCRRMPKPTQPRFTGFCTISTAQRFDWIAVERPSVGCLLGRDTRSSGKGRGSMMRASQERRRAARGNREHRWRIAGLVVARPQRFRDPVSRHRVLCGPLFRHSTRPDPHPGAATDARTSRERGFDSLFACAPRAHAIRTRCRACLKPRPRPRGASQEHRRACLLHRRFL